MGFLTTPMSGQRIELWSGNFLDLENPEDCTITREDIVRGLANTCRFAGQCRRFYSVAEHSVLVADLLARTHRDVCLAGLLHDSAEAFIGDMTAPLKFVMRNHEGEALDLDKWDRSSYDDIGDGLNAAIWKRFGLPDTPVPFDDEEVAMADYWAFVIEARSLLSSGGVGYNVPSVVAELGGLPDGIVWHAGLDPTLAAALFRARWEEYVD